jgi:hypothetical protein
MTSVDRRFAGARLIRNQAIGKKRDDPLPSLLRQLLVLAGEPTTVERAVTRPWASALFEGRRHLIRLHVRGEDCLKRSLTLMAVLTDAEWHISGHFVADITVDNGDVDDEGGVWLDLSALTIEDR